MRRCPATRCPQLIPDQARYCSTHAREYEARRGTSTRRGYDSRHQQARRVEAQRVANLEAICPRCGLLILPTEPWDLGHTDDRNGYQGAEHSRCNRSAGGRNGARESNPAR